MAQAGAMNTTATDPTDLTPELALAWLRRWDDQQATFFADREERFDVIIDVIGHVIDRPDPLVVDLGLGPGSLAHRLQKRIPGAHIVGVDMDPLLLGLASTAYGGPRFRTVQADLRNGDWLDRLELDRAPDAFISTTALHWLEREPLMACLQRASSALASSGCVVDGDHLYELDAAHGLDEVNRRVAQEAGRRAGGSTGEGWQEWWDAALAAPELTHLAEARARIDLDHPVADKASVHDYLEALRAGGCREAGQVWQCGDDRVIVGLR